MRSALHRSEAGSAADATPARERTTRAWTVEFDTRRGFSATWRVRCDLAAARRKARRVCQALGWTVVRIH